jgi:tetratricopeptide (TPR) repeat protein/AraC-like DNA-binding protein
MRITIYFLLFFITNCAFSQINFILTDQEYQKLHDRARFLINSNIDSSFIYANKIEQSNSNLHKSFAYGIKSYLYQLKGDSIKSKQLYKQAFTYLNKIPASNDKTKLNAYLFNYGGLANWKRGHLSKAVEYYQEGEKLSRKVNDLIQVVKFNNNIAIINREIGNFKLSIEASKESDRVTDNIEYLYDVDKFYNTKSQINLNLGDCYEKLFLFNPKNNAYLDSATYYYKKTIVYSKYIETTRLIAELGIANISILKMDYTDAKKRYHKLLLETKNLEDNYCLVNFGLGRTYYELKEYDKALICFKKVDSIYITNKKNTGGYVYSNYYQAKIYAANKDYDGALKHSKLYLENFKKLESKLDEEILGVNAILSDNDLKKEMIALQKEHKNQNALRYGLFFSAIIIVLFFFIKNHIEKNKANKKVKLLIEQFKNKETNFNDELNHSLIEDNKLTPDVLPSNLKSVLVLDAEKEKEILEKLKKLEEKLEYLKEDYTQQYVAKKIKTNTAYLSYVINKNFQKSFSEYSNQLKINYVISEMIANQIYRKYSTQAIAESVGFKNASSFTKSFSKRTGVTPVQFAKNIDA